MGFFHRLRVAVWGVPPDTAAERRLLFKIDFFILTYVCLMYWVNYLDRANLNNAYVSGAREDLNFKGTQLNQINTIFYGGYLLGMYILTKIRDMNTSANVPDNRSSTKQLDIAENSSWIMASLYLRCLGPSDTWHCFRPPSLANHGHPLLPGYFRSQLLCWRTMDPRILVQA